jgi:hypothetical protein
MYVRTPAGQIERPRCEPGDMVVYRGIEIEHWREPFDAEEGSYQVQVFLHYVDANGGLKHLKYDQIFTFRDSPSFVPRMRNFEQWRAEFRFNV